MSRRAVGLDDALYDYLLQVSLREPPELARVREESLKLKPSRMLSTPEQIQFLAFLADLIGAERALDIGTFTGYSALAVARILPEEGRLDAFEINEESARIARRNWEAGGIADKVTLHLGRVEENLQNLLNQGFENAYDFSYIDADKRLYPKFYELSLQLIRPGGVIVIDNTLWEGKVADSEACDETTEALRAFNLHLKGDERVNLSMLPVGDGTTILKKR